MKRADGEGTTYQRKDGLWCAQVMVQTPDGLKARKTVYAKSQREVLAKKREIDRQQQAGTPVATSRPPTLTVFGESWLTQTLASRVETHNLAPATWNFYRDHWVRHIEPDLGHHRLDLLTASIIRAWLSRKSKEQSRLGRPLSPRTVQALHATLRKALDDAVRDGLLAQNPAKAVDGPSLPTRRARYLTRDQAQHLLEVMRDDRHEVLWTLLLGCGLRIGEALALRS